MVIAKKGFAVHQNGFLYTNENIDRMLFERHISKKMRKAGKYTSKHKKRTSDDDMRFEIFFENLINKIITKDAL